MDLSSWLTLGCPSESANLLTNLSCLSASQDRYLSPGCWKSLGFLMVAFSLLPASSLAGFAHGGDGEAEVPS